VILGKVIGNIVTVIKDEKYNGLKVMIVQEMDMNGNLEQNYFISIDLIGVGIDEVVMVVNGTPARSSDETFDKGVDSIIVAKIEILIFEDRELKFQ
jgi:microcompartment protein CcmK/EutM